jgi:hypothetical protein
MLNAIQLEMIEIEKPVQSGGQFPIQEQFTNLAIFSFERTMSEILAERIAEAGSMMAGPLFIP